MDKLKTGEAEKVVSATAEAISKRPAAFPVLIATSAEKGGAIDELRAAIADLI